ncbi:MAG: hypothetical protein CM15mV4_0860 [Caudoviricetes sp.]|nr:MAG: hypothetical protein CM15mV4_0860 [Caudoviricetes sp.]
MDKNHLKLMIKQLKMVVEELEAEVYSDPTSTLRTMENVLRMPIKKKCNGKN